MDLTLGKNIVKFTRPDIHLLFQDIKELTPRHCPISHFFAPGVYVRQMVIPQGTMAIGHNHKYSHLCTVLTGRILFFPDENNIDVWEAPHTFLARPGHKMVYAIEDTIVQNVHPNPDNITDQDELEELFLDKTDYPELIIKDDRAEDRIDFDRLGYKEPDRKYYNVPNGFNTAITYRLSHIHGKGVFATIPFSYAEYIAPYQIDGKYTTIAQYINHSITPNCAVLKLSDENMVLAAAVTINGCMGDSRGEELTINYRSIIS